MNMKITSASLTLISLVVISLILAGQSYAIDQEALLGMWLMDEGEGEQITDSSGNEHHGKIEGSVTWVDGKFQKALEFDGTGYVNAGEVLLPSNAVTAVLWASVDTSQQWIHLIESGVVEYTWHGGFRLELGGEGVIYIGIGDGGAYKDNAGNGVDTGWKYKEWFHLGFTYDGKIARYYHNSVENHTFESELDISKGFGTVIFGSMQGTGRFLEGRIDDAAVFNAVLSQDDIKTIMDNGLDSMVAVSPLGKLSLTWGKIKQD